MILIRIGHSGMPTWISLKAKFRCRLLDWISKRDMSVVQVTFHHVGYLRILQNVLKLFPKGAFKYDVRFLGRQVGQATSDFTKQAYVVKYLIRVGRQVKNTQKTSDVICECSQSGLTTFPKIFFILGSSDYLLSKSRKQKKKVPCKNVECKCKHD